MGYRWVCPSCLAKSSYLRRYWKFDIPVCFQYEVYLERRCPLCQFLINLNRINRFLKLGACSNCCRSLSKVPSRPVETNSVELRAAREVLQLVQDGPTVSPVDWLDTRVKFFEVMAFVMRFLLVLNGNPGGILGRAGIPSNGGLRLRTLGQTWTTVQSRDTTKTLARDNQRLFNKYIVQPSTTSPRVLRRFQRNPGLRDRSSLWQSVRAISGRGELVSYAKIARETGLTEHTVYGRAPPKLKEYMRRQRRDHYGQWKQALRTFLES